MKCSFIKQYCILISLLVFLSACSQATSEILSEETNTPVATTAPTEHVFPTDALEPSATPTITPTLIPVPSKSELDEKFRNEVDPLLIRLSTAIEDTSYELSENYRIEFVPESDRLYYIQSVLQLTDPQNSNIGDIVYVVYGFERGETLGYSLGYTLYVSTETQEIITHIRVYIDNQDGIYLVEEEETKSGSGSNGFFDLVGNAVPLLSKLPTSAEEVKTNLETYIGYACGIDMISTLDRQRKVSLMDLALSNDSWSGRLQAIQTLASIDPPVVEEAALLLSLLSDGNSQVSGEAEDLLASLVKVDDDVLDQVIQAADSEDAKVRRHVASILSERPEESLATILVLGCDESESVREAAQYNQKRAFPRSLLRKIVRLKDE